MVAKGPSRKRDDVTSRKRDNDDIPPKGPGSPARFKGKPRGPGRSCQVGNLKKAMKVVAKLGGRVEVMPDNSIHLIPAGQAPATPPADKNSWDEVYASDTDRPA
jgi:hypothetical protein